MSASIKGFLPGVDPAVDASPAIDGVDVEPAADEEAPVAESAVIADVYLSSESSSAFAARGPSPSAPVEENDSQGEYVDIRGLEKGDVLAALYNAASPLGLGYLQYDRKSMTSEEGKRIYRELGGFRVDYVRGKPIKANLSGDTFCSWTYDRDNGRGKAR